MLSATMVNLAIAPHSSHYITNESKRSVRVISSLFVHHSRTCAHERHTHANPTPHVKRSHKTCTRSTQEWECNTFKEMYTLSLHNRPLHLLKSNSNPASKLFVIFSFFKWHHLHFHVIYSPLFLLFLLPLCIGNIPFPIKQISIQFQTHFSFKN